MPASEPICPMSKENITSRLDSSSHTPSSPKLFSSALPNPTFNAPCVDASGAPIGDPTPADPAGCNGVTSFPNDAFLPLLLPYDLTRGGQLFRFNGHTDIKQEALYGQDAISLGNLTLNLGLRFDNYNGIVGANAVQPRVGLSYLIKRTNTVLRGSYSRTFETPYNENLILSVPQARGD